jgi:hypothetical protein
LDYGDKVCSSNAKCVSDDAVCFDSYTCNYSGFVCKSDFESLTSEYDDLARNAQQLATEYDDLANRFNRLRQLSSNVTDCVDYASSLEEAQSCT